MWCSAWDPVRGTELRQRYLFLFITHLITTFRIAGMPNISTGNFGYGLSLKFTSSKLSIVAKSEKINLRIIKGLGKTNTIENQAELGKRSHMENHEAVLPRKTRPDTRLPQSCAGGQGLYLRSFDHLGRSSDAKDRKKPKKVICDGPTDQWTN